MKNDYCHFESEDEIKRIENQIDNILIDEEILWKQRSRADWLREGDRSTKFFHAKASARRKKNRIHGIEDENGEWTEDAEEVERMFGEYFTNIFTTSSPSSNQLNAALEAVPVKVTGGMNSHLDQLFTEEEIVEALAQMCPMKGPGPDGLPAAFFQKHWSSVKEGVLATCMHILNKGGNLALLNHTFITLIPKVSKLRKVSELRPISLCNIIYRIVAKTMANRLKKVLDDIISPNQSAFVPNRLITDNIIIGYECLNKIRQSRGRKKRLIALKLDISKAYDRVEWSFVKETLLKLGFSVRWVNLVMNCISTASFSVLINGEARGLIYPQRGLRQGCPLSPYLFIMCAEVFSNLLGRAEGQNLIHGLNFSREIFVTHLLFADDNLVFTRASSFDCRELKKVFDVYSAASGQIFNYEKSSMFFSSSTSQRQVEEIRSIFDLTRVPKREKYLGLPSMVRRAKISFFNDIKLRVLSKLLSWQSKCFSSRGKEILIKAVAQAVPVYAMSVFKIPQTLCDDIEKDIARFWWGSTGVRRSIHWSRWNRLCHVKKKGGLGFRDLSCFNKALIAKQGWRILHSPDSLMAKILKEKYFRGTGFMEAKLGSNPSFVWRSIILGRQLLNEGLRWRIGNSRKVSVHSENWIHNYGLFISTPLSSLHHDAVVADLINDGQQWKEDLIAQNFSKDISEEILRIPLPRTPRHDALIWCFDKHGKYSVKSGYQVAVKEKFKDVPSCSDSSKSRWDVIWSTELLEKVKIFMWRAAKNLLPTESNLWKRKIVLEPECQRCGCKIEDVVHALLECKAARRVWKKTELYEEIKSMVHRDMLSVLQEVALKRSKEDREMITAICWAIWHSRNLLLFEGKQEDSLLSIARAEAIVESYKRVNLSNGQATLKIHRKKHQTWLSPPEGWYKVNIDAAIKFSDQQAGLGVVIRNARGKIIAAAVKRVLYRGDVSSIEAEAILFGIQNAIQLNCMPMIIESDSSEVVELSLSKKGSLAEIAWKIVDIQLLLKSQNPSRIQYVPRECNAIADSLAKLALNFEDLLCGWKTFQTI